MFLLLTAVDLLAINALLSGSSDATRQLGLMWLLFYSSVAGWAIGLRAWKECQGNCAGTQTMLRLLACSALVYAACTAALQFGGQDPQSWLAVYLFLSVYVLRLTPPAAATVVLTPFLWISQPRLKTLALLLICQVCCWYGGYRLTEGQPDWQHAFLYVGMWAPNWGFGLMVGGLMLKPLLKNEPPKEIS